MRVKTVYFGGDYLSNHYWRIRKKCYVHHVGIKAFLYIGCPQKANMASLSDPPHTQLSLDLLPPDFLFTVSSAIILLSLYNVCNLFLECHLRKPLSRHSHTWAVSTDSCSACHPAHLLTLLLRDATLIGDARVLANLWKWRLCWLWPKKMSEYHRDWPLYKCVHSLTHSLTRALSH